MATEPRTSAYTRHLSNTDHNVPTGAPDVFYMDTRATKKPRPEKTPGSRSGAPWFSIGLGTLLLVALIVFILQNTQMVQVSFLGMQGSVPLALALLIAGVGIGTLTLITSTLRNRRRNRRHAS